MDGNVRIDAADSAEGTELSDMLPADNRLSDHLVTMPNWLHSQNSLSNGMVSG